MSLEINLLTQKQVISTSLLNISKIIQKIAVILLGLFILLFLIFFSLQFFYTNKIKDIQKRIDIAKQQIQQAKATESVYLAFYQKLTNVDNIVKVRFMPTTIIKEINKVMPKDAVIISMDLNPKNVSLNIEVSSLEALQEVISGLQNKLTLPVAEINLSGIDKIKGKYQTRFLLNFK